MSHTIEGIGLPLSLYSTGSFSFALMSISLGAVVVPCSRWSFVVGLTFSSCLRKGLRMMGILGGWVHAEVGRSRQTASDFNQSISELIKMLDRPDALLVMWV